MRNAEECVIWSEAGVFLQTYDREGQMRLSDMGALSLASVQEFCDRRGIPVYVRRRNMQAIVSAGSSCQKPSPARLVSIPLG